MIRTFCAALLVLGSVLVATTLAFSPLVIRASTPQWLCATAGSGELVVCDDVPFLSLVGSPAERGRQQALLVGVQAHDLLGFMGVAADYPVRRNRAFVDACVAAIRPQDRAEITAIATEAGLDPGTLLRTNALIETMCSAVVHVGANGTRLGRNMDFAPVDARGASTMISVVRENGQHTYASITWPGMCGVISGMNDRGLVACILLNWRCQPAGPGEPLPLRVRHILQTCDNMEAAVAQFTSAPVGSAHFLLLADPHQACVVWNDTDGIHRDNPVNGWLIVDNEKRVAGTSTGKRAATLQRETSTIGVGVPDLHWCRRATTATYMPCDNAQAMTFDCGLRRLELARGTTITAAALRSWVGINLGQLLDGAPISSAQVERLPAVVPFRHYLR